MARPIKQTVDYFPHDAVPGKTIFILQSRFGNNGYAAWFKLLALLCRTPGLYYDARTPANWQFLLAEMALMHTETLAILDCCAELNAIDPELWQHRIIWSTNLLKRVEDAFDRRKGFLPVKPDINAINVNNNPINVGNNRESKGKEIKGNKSIVATETPEIFTSLKKDGLKEVVEVFEKCGGIVSSEMIAQELADAEREYGSQVVIAGFRRASASGKSGIRIINYCKPIWEDYKANGIPSKEVKSGLNTKPSRELPKKYTDPSELESW